MFIKYERKRSPPNVEALASVGLAYRDVRGKYLHQFSDGELQRVSIARALIPRPGLIVADEPVSMIDASRRMIIINQFLSLKQEYKTSILYITYDLATAYYISDYIAVMNKGSIVEFGQAKQVLSDPQHSYTQLLLDSIPTLVQRHETVRETDKQSVRADKVIVNVEYSTLTIHYQVFSNG